MFVKADARNLLLRGERRRFLAEQWPGIYAAIQRLGLTREELLDAAAARRMTSDSEQEER